MCDHTLDPGGREAAMIVLDPGTPERKGRDGVWCDPCIAPLVKALNDGGIRTVASCCGHGKRPGSIILADERWLFILPDRASADALDHLMPYPDINGGSVERAEAALESMLAEQARSSSGTENA